MTVCWAEEGTSKSTMCGGVASNNPQTVQPSQYRGKRPESRLPLLMSRFVNSAVLYIHMCVSLSCMSKIKRSCGGGAASGDADTPETGPLKHNCSFMTS